MANTASDPAPAADPSPTALRQVLGRYATGVTIVTCRGPEGERVGMTANSFSALSLEPPLVLWSLRRASASLGAFRAASHFAINILAESQVELSRQFASPVADKFADGPWSEGTAGVPVLASAAAVIECERSEEHDGGDHVLFIGRVCQLANTAALSAPPLVFHGGRYHMLGEIL
jgi:3-hydroxy-9,10-secoandrosta-1,3,5(10)-triene-9,17-dione monooxygenase reductase component